MTVIDALFDAGSVLELRRAFAPGMITALARVEGRPVGVVLSDGKDHSLGGDDLQLAMQPLEGYQLEREGSHAVALDLHLDDVHVARHGGRHPQYEEAQGQRVMKQSEITVRVHLHRGAAASEVWTCDLSHDYVSINADYRS